MIAGHKVFAFKRPSDLGIIGDWGLGIGDFPGVERRVEQSV